MALILIVTFVIYWPARQFAFLNYDDPLYIVDNPVVKHGLTWPGAQWAFTTMHASNWHPVTWLSHMLDVDRFGAVDAGAHRLVNIVIHMFNVTLLFVVLNRMTRAPWRSVFVAGLFALHPLRVESVAWVSERKDVLSTLFGILAILAYAQYSSFKRPAPQARPTSDQIGLDKGTVKRLSFYLAAVLCFALSLMAKPMLVTLPCVLLLLDAWPLRRWNRMGGDRTVALLVIEKIPFFMLSAASAWMTVRAQQLGGSLSPLDHIAIDQRFENAAVAYSSYIAMFFWPVDLAVLYPHPGEWETWRVVMSGLLLVVITAVVSALRGARPALLVGWLWYLGTLVPVIGLVQVGLQSMADRYTYVPHIGLAIMMAWSIPTIVARKAIYAVMATAALAILALVATTRHQLGYWRNSVTLFEHCIAVTDRNYIAHHNLASAFEQSKEYDRAIDQYRKALAINPNYISAHNNLGLLIAGRDPDAGVQHLRRAVELRPDSSLLRSNLGLALANKGLLDEAAAELERAVQLEPRDVQAHINLGRVFAKRQKFDRAIDHYLEALLREPDMPDVHCDLGVALMNLGERERAIAHFEAALKIRPDYERAKTFRAKALEESGPLNSSGAGPPAQ